MVKSKKPLMQGMFSGLYAETITLNIKAVLEKMFQTQFDALVAKHFDNAHEITAVRYQGEKYRTSVPMKMGSLLIEPCEVFRSMEALDEMHELVQWRNAENMKLKMVTQVLGRLLQGTQTNQDIRNALPDGVVALLAPPEIRAMSRTKPWLEGIDNPMLIAQARGLEEQAEALSALILVA